MHVLFKLAERAHLLLQKERVYQAPKGTANWEADRRRLASPWLPVLSPRQRARASTPAHAGPHATTDVVVLPRKQAKLQCGNQNDSPSWRPGAPRAPAPATFPTGGRGASLRGPHGVGPAKVGAALHKLPARTSHAGPQLAGCSPPGSPDAEIPSPSFVGRFHGVAEFYTVLCHRTVFCKHAWSYRCQTNLRNEDTPNE